MAISPASIAPCTSSRTSYMQRANTIQSAIHQSKYIRFSKK